MQNKLKQKCKMEWNKRANVNTNLKIVSLF